MKAKSLRRGGIARLFHGAANSVLTLEAECLRLDGDGAPSVIALRDLVRLASKENGVFWAGVVFTTSRDARRFGGFPKDQTAAFVDDVNAQLQPHFERTLNHACAPLVDAVAGTVDLLSEKRYVRASQRKAVVTHTKSALEVTNHALWPDFATDQQRELAQSAQRFVEGSAKLVEHANERFVEAELNRYATFFDSVESQPLTISQRRACVISEDNNLVLAGAGTGKTSTIIGRAGYLLASARVQPSELLMLAYGRKAAGEMQERQDTRLAPWLDGGSPKIKTFHALGLEIIGNVEGKRPDVSPMAEDSRAYARFITEQVDALCVQREYRRELIRYLGSEQYPYRSPFDFASMHEYMEYVRTNELRTLMGELVKSYEETVVANFLTMFGVDYEYEAPYEVETAGPDYRQYKPDFYLPSYGIYIEHFALDENGRPPRHFDQTGYLDGIAWKRDLHEKHGTTLIETYSHLQRSGVLEKALEEKLIEAGVTLDRRRDEEIFEELRRSSSVTDFAEMLGQFLTLFKQSGLSLKSIQKTIAHHRDCARLTLLLELFVPVIEAYEAHLSERRQIDFNDMIHRAIGHVQSGAYSSPFTHIMVDEFQDISAPRADLVKALRAQRDDAIVFTVGDDWQAIYRFAGSDIGYTRYFEKHFGATVTTALDTTFRFNDSIEKVSSAFILRNPAQMRKTITSLVASEEPAVSLIRVLLKEQGLMAALSAIERRVASAETRDRATVLVLGRYNFEVSDWRAPGFKRTLADDRPSIAVEFATVHSAKGKEADYVIVVGLAEGKYGFPCEVPTDKIFELLLPEAEEFTHAEERRLFYVALTRARHRVYLAYNPMASSAFIPELLDDPRSCPVTTDEFGESDGVCAEFPRVRCPNCESGYLVPRVGPYGAFFGCSHFPRCSHIDKPCPLCGGMMQKQGRQKVCTNCGGVVPICPECGGSMVERSGPNSRFWGCSNYRGKPGESAFTCTHTEKI